MKATTRRAWRRDLRTLRAECPPLLPVRVRLQAGPAPDFGMTGLSADGTTFNLTLYRRHVEKDGTERDVTRQELLDALVHEWAHCLSWSSGHVSLEDHDPAWGLAYSRCYQTTSDD